MDLKTYISSGIIERYVLDSVSPQEKQEVECMSHIYPEIDAEVKQIQLAIEQMAIRSAVTPPAALKTNILSKISQTSQEPAKGIVKDEKGGKIVQMNAPTTEKSGTPIFKLLAAASIAGIIALGYYTLNLHTEKTEMAVNLSDQSSEIAQLENEKQELAIAFNNISTKTFAAEKKIAILKDPNVSQIPMKGTLGHPDLLATIYWNSSNNQVLLELDNLPTPPTDKQYQLWAIVDGVPMDMGVFSTDEDLASLIEMNTTGKSEAFAVTLEPKGGSAVPTMEEMYVIGFV